MTEIFAFAAGLVALGSIGFWVVLVLLGIAVSELADEEKGGGATVLALGTFLVWFWLEGINPIHWAIAYPQLAAAGIGGYFVIGIVWSVVKWWLFCLKARRRIDRLAADFKERVLPEIERRNADPHIGHETIPAAWRGHLSNRGIHGDDVTRPLARKHKARIILWMSYWPASMLWTLINDPVRRAFRAAYDVLAGLFQRISDSAFKGADHFTGGQP